MERLSKLVCENLMSRLWERLWERIIVGIEGIKGIAKVPTFQYSNIPIFQNNYLLS